MQEVVLRHLLSRKSAAQVVLASPFPDIDNKIYRSVRVVKAGRRNLIYALFKLLLIKLSPGLARRLLKNNQEYQAYSEASLVVDLSGDMLTEDYGGLIALSHAIPLWMAKVMDRPYVILAQSVGPFKKLHHLYKYLLDNAEYVTVRDEPSLKYIRDMGVPKVELTADLAFCAREESPELPHLNQLFSKARVVGVCLSSLLTGKFAKFQEGDYLGIVQDVLLWADSNNRRVVFISHVEHRNPRLSDTALHRALLDKLHRSDIPVLGEDLSPFQIKWIISKLEVLVSFRMHPCVAAIDSATPVIGISYSHKTRGLFALAGIEENVMGVAACLNGALPARLDDVLKNEKAIRAKLEAARGELRAASERNLFLLDRLVGQ